MGPTGGSERTGFFRSVDRLIVALHPLMVGLLVVAIACGVLLAALGAAAWLGWVDLGDFLEDLGPGWVVGGGLGIAVGALGGIFTFQEEREKARARLMPPSPWEPGADDEYDEYE